MSVARTFSECGESHASPRATAFSDTLAMGMVLMSIVLALAAFYFASTALRLSAVGCGLIVYGYMLLTSSNARLGVASALLVLIWFPIAILAAGRTEWRSLFLALSFLSATGAAWFAVERQKTILLMEVPFVGFLGMTLALVALGYGPREFNEVLSGASRNGYSAILVAMTCGYVLSRHLRGRKPSLLFLGLAFMASFPLYGRSSIATLGFILVSTALITYPGVGTLVIAALALAAAGLAWSLLDLLEVVGSATNFKAGLVSDRWTMLADYWESLNVRTALLGVDLRELPSVVANDGNPDLSLLRIHSYVGLGVLPLLMMFAVSAVQMFAKRKWLLLAIFLAIIFRSATDVILLFGTMDYFFLPLLMFPLFFPGHAAGAQILKQPLINRIL